MNHEDLEVWRDSLALAKNIRKKLLGLIKYLKSKQGYTVKDSENEFLYE